ncbi:MAG: hypothetical protein NC086_00315, partial [Alistipes sp.]|nr:hypothetical protein [Alistipes sp.]
MKNFFQKIWEHHIIPVLVMAGVFVNKMWPLLSISRYNHSNADDYWMSSNSHFVWEDTHSFLTTVASGFRNAVAIWKNWDGCFLSMFIGCLPPVVFHEKYYKYTFAIIAGMFALGATALLFVLLVRMFKFPIAHWLLITMAMLIMFFNFMPSIKEAYYWWVGGINYAFLAGIFLLSQALLLEYIVSGNKICLGFGSFFAFCVGIGNLLTGLVNPVILILELIVLVLTYKKEKLLFIIPTVCGVAGLLCNVLAPGNLIRGGDGLFHNPVFASIFDTLVVSAKFIPEFFKRPMTWFFLLILVVVIDGMARRKAPFRFRYPLLFVPVSFGVYASAFTPVVYVGSAYYGRCKNISYYLFLFMLLLDAVYITGWVFDKFSVSLKEAVKKGMIYGALALLLVSVKADWLYFDSEHARTSMNFGQAQDFHAKVMGRFNKYYDPGIREVFVEPIDWIPTVFYWDDDC